MAPEESLVGTVIGPYKIISELGRGGMGIVYKALETSLDRLVALKVLSRTLTDMPAFVQRFEREAKAAAKLNHPRIVTIHSVGEYQKTHYIAMEFVKGKSLMAEIRERGALDLRRAMTITRQCADALVEAHGKNVVHRDIKPDNIMLDEAGRVKVMDFGLARVMLDVTRLTTTGSQLGTPLYMSPEQCEGDTVDGRTDIYSLGVTLFEMLSGQPPFSGKTPLAVMYQINKASFPKITDYNPAVPKDIERILLKMVEKSPANRYNSAERLRADIDRWLGIGETPRPAAVPTPPDGLPSEQPTQSIPVDLSKPSERMTVYSEIKPKDDAWPETEEAKPPPPKWLPRERPTDFMTRVSRVAGPATPTPVPEKGLLQPGQLGEKPGKRVALIFVMTAVLSVAIAAAGYLSFPHVFGGSRKGPGGEGRPNRIPIGMRTPIAFPQDQSLGTIYVRVADSTDAAAWQAFADATGPITKPHGKEFQLRVSDLEATDLSALAQLDARAIESLWLPSGDISDDALRRIGSLDGLKELVLPGGSMDEATLARLRAALPHCKIVSAPEAAAPPELLAAAEPGSASPPGPQTMVFPASSRGTLFTRDWNATDAEPWEKLGSAQGSVTIPEGKVVKLEVFGSAAENLDWLVPLKADALDTLSLTGRSVDDAALKRITHLSALREMRLFDVKVTDDGLAVLENFPQLRTLVIVRAPRIAKQALEHIEKLSSLGRLHMEGTDVTPELLILWEDGPPGCKVTYKSTDRP